MPTGDEGALCLPNPSFEGMPLRNATGADFDVEPWIACAGPERVLITASVWDETLAEETQVEPSPLPADGETYLRMTSCVAPECFQPFLGSGSDRVHTATCEPLRAGTPYSFSVALASPDALSSSWGNTRGAVELWGGDGQCDERELLWTSPLLTPSFERHCVTITPTRDTTALLFKIVEENGLKFVYVDDIRRVDACPCAARRPIASGLAVCRLAPASNAKHGCDSNATSISSLISRSLLLA